MKSQDSYHHIFLKSNILYFFFFADRTRLSLEVQKTYSYFFFFADRTLP